MLPVTEPVSGPCRALRAYNRARHLGDLSAAALPGHPAAKVQPKYARWARRLFQEVPAATPRLAVDVKFWCAA